MDIENYITVGRVLENGDTVFHITDTEYWVVAPQSLWKECDWEEGVGHCLLNGYEMPDRETLELIYTHKDDLPVSSTSNVWSSTDFNSHYAWNLSFGNGYWCNGSKYVSSWVVPFRKVPIDSVLEGGHCTDSRVLTDTVAHTVDRVQISTVARDEVPEDYREMMARESHHDHPIVRDANGTLRWMSNPEVVTALESISLNDLIPLLHTLGYGKNSELYRHLYRCMGYSLSGYWEVFYWEANNPEASKYIPPETYVVWKSAGIDGQATRLCVPRQDSWMHEGSLQQLKGKARI